MKYVLDHCVSRPLLSLLPEFDIDFAGKLGWAQLSNGKLLTACEDAGYSALITVDKGFKSQQNLTGRRISVVLLSVPDTRLDFLIPLLPRLRSVLEDLEMGRLIEIE